MTKKKTTTRTCGKCKTAFPAGRGHDARTCGKKTVNLNSGKSNVVVPKPPLLPPITTPNLSLRPDVTAKREVPQASAYLWQISVAGTVQILGEANAKNGRKDWVNLPSEWLNKYNYAQCEGWGVWFNEYGLADRPNGPAVEWANGYKEWWVNGELHRKDGPAVEQANGSKEWWVNDHYHRLDGPAVEQANGSKEWWVNGKLHREDGPAVVKRGGYKEWWVNGERHRLDGPAIERADGSKDWYVRDIITEYPELCEKAIQTDLTREEFYKLCIHDDYVVRGLALANPRCPIEYKIVAKLVN